MRFRFASWNIRNVGDGHLADGLVKLIQDVSPDVLALQEVNPKFHTKLAMGAGFAWAACSLDLRPPLCGDSDDRKRGCSLFGKSPFRLVKQELVISVPFAEQTLVVSVNSRDGDLTPCSFHIPPGCNHPREKVMHLYGIAYWLRDKTSNTVFGIDANEPKNMDRLKGRSSRKDYAKDGALELLGSLSPGKRWHSLRDCFREFILSDPLRLRELQMCEVERGSRETKRGDGPLAVSYIRRRGDTQVPCRYDFVYATPDLHTYETRYLYERSRQAGSDHAMVVSDLECAVAPN